VAADGTVDWWCPVRFDAEPLLTRLLDPAGACVRVGPQTPGRPPVGTQRYVPGTLVLRTLLPGPESLVEVEDLIPWDGGTASGRLVRRLRVLRGPADVVVEVIPGAAGGGLARDVSVWDEGVAFDGALVRCGLPMTVASVPPPAPARARRRLAATAGVRLDTGEELVVTVDPPGRAGGPLSPGAAARLADRTATAWRRVADSVAVTGRYGPPATRSALVVRALAGAAGAPVGAPTTSLPRVVGGERNTDGRLVWPVTAAAWARASMASGLTEEADAALRWLVAALDHEPPLPACLDPDGGAPPSEAHRSTLAGWRRSQPVMCGSDAPDRPSAEPGAAALGAAARLAAGPAGAAVLARWDRVVAHADWLADHWTAPDASVWDLRGPALGWTAARLAARAALVAVAAEARRRRPLDLDAPGWHAAAGDIERWLLGSGVGPGGVLRAAVGGSGLLDGPVDAALVRIAAWGPWPPGDPVVHATLTRIVAMLGHGPWLHPYPPELDDGLAGTEPPSVTATLWLTRALALAGRWDEAHQRMESTVALAGPLHLLPESVDAATGHPLGNRPASAAHVAFLEAALALADAPS